MLPEMQSKLKTIKNKNPNIKTTLKKNKEQAPVMTDRTFRIDEFAKAYKHYLKNCYTKTVLDNAIQGGDLKDDKLDAIIEERQKYNDNIKYFESYYGIVLSYILRRQLSPLETFGYQTIFNQFQGCKFQSYNASELINTSELIDTSR